MKRLALTMVWMLTGGWACSQGPSSAAVPPPPRVALRVRAISFANTKPLLGLPTKTVRSRAACSEDGLTWFEPEIAPEAVVARAAGDVYSASAAGEVKHVQRKIPTDYTNVSVRDFYAGDRTLVTLLEADQRQDDGVPHGRRFFLSVSDHDGDGSELLGLDFHFRPLKVGVFGAGDYLVLGWDEANLLPVLALLKGDGSVRRFMDLEDRTGRQTEAAHEAATAKILEGAVFVPFGEHVLLTYPGTTRAIRVLSAVGEDRTVTLQIPGGYVLNDVLGTDYGHDLVARVRDEPSGDTKPLQRLFEFDAIKGSLGREFTLGKLRMTSVSCAAGFALTAIFVDATEGSATAGHTVVGSARR